MPADLVSIISIVTGVIAAAGALWAARGAQRSAATAQEAAKRAENAERRQLLKALLADAHGVVAESNRVASLVEEVKSEYRTLAVFTGNTGGSRQKLYIERADAKLTEVVPMQEQAQKMIEEQASLRSASEEDLTEASSKFQGYHVHVRRLRDELEREQSSIAAQNQVYRENRINPHSQGL
jgi:hypothetical protein